MDQTEHALAGAVAQAFRAVEAEALAANRLARDLAAKRARLGELVRAAERLVSVLDGDARRQAVQDLAALRARTSRKRDDREHARLRAVEAFLRTHKHQTFTPKDLQAFLKRRDLSVPDPRYAARTLARKARQGHVMRVSTGVYRAVA